MGNENVNIDNKITKLKNFMILWRIEGVRKFDSYYWLAVPSAVPFGTTDSTFWNFDYLNKFRVILSLSFVTPAFGTTAHPLPLHWLHKPQIKKQNVNFVFSQY